MNILIIESEASPTAGGAEKSMSSFCDYLNNEGDKVFLICEKYNPDYGVSIENILILNLQPFKSQGVLNYLRTINSISKFINKNKLEILLTHCIHIMPLLHCVKYITNISMVIYFKWIYNKPSIGRTNKWGLSGFDKYVALNKFVGDYWEDQLNKSLLFEYVPDGVDFPKTFDFNNSESITYNLLYFGRIFEGKGLHLLIKALNDLPSDYKLTVLGDYQPENLDHKDFEYHRDINNQVKILNLENRIEFKGLVNNVSEYINKASLVIVPSIIDDAQPFSILESFANGCPAIGSKRGGIPYLFEEDEFWLFDLNNKTISKKIINILEDEKKALIFKTKKRYVDLQKRYNRNTTQKLLRSICINLIK